MDTSFSFEENDDNPIVCSTPKRPKLVCPSCHKIYIVKHYFHKHLATHSASSASVVAASAADESVVSAAAVSLQDGDVTFGSIISVRTDENTQKRFKLPSVPAKKKVKPKYVCTYCLKGYICEKSYKNHLMLHRVQDAASRYPDKVTILRNAREISNKALDKVKCAPVSKCNAAFPMFVQQVNDLASVSSMQWINFSTEVCLEILDCTVGKKFILPSAILSTLLGKVESILDNRVMCKNFLDMLEIPALMDLQQNGEEFEDRAEEEEGSCHGDVASQFFLEYILNFAKEILVFISSEVRSSNASLPKDIPELDEEDKKVIYYIGGSIIRGYFRIAYRHKSNIMWRQIADVLKAKVLTDDASLIQDASWTVAVSRGGLLLISPLCQEFLISLTEVVFSLEKRDGSLDFMEVITNVTKGEICMLWDKMIGESLSENVSLQLMNDVIKFFCRTCGRGFARKRLNCLRDRPLISLTTRHLAATRKGRK